jgi:nicotinamide-nucleotide amidase
MFSVSLLRQAELVIAKAKAQGLKIATAESCTGGLLAACLTEIAGASDVFEFGFVSYANKAKVELLGVSNELLARHGAVSEPVARAMAEGALARAHADLALAVTGVAGPSGGNKEKPVGLVHLAAAAKGRGTAHEAHRFGGIGRAAVRMKSVEAALALAARML